MKPTYEELEAKVLRLEELLKQALERISQLEEQLKRNSKNSSKPPSTDQKNNTPDSDKKLRDSRAGKARPSFPPDKIDKHVQCTLENCPHCGSSKLQLSGHSPEILQQAELPEIKATITEFQLQKYQCNECRKNSTACLPPGIPDSAFGPKLMGLLATLTGVLHVAKREAIQLIKELYAVDMGVGSVPNVEERVAAALDPVYDRIHKFVVQHKFCTHFDETSWRDSGKRHFVWLATCQQAAVYRIDRNRSTAAFKRLIGQETWTAPAVTDRYAVYNSFKDHQFCLAHLIREFKGYGEREGPDKAIGLALENELRLSCKVHREYREEKISLVQRNRRLGARKRRVEYWLDDGLANGSDALAKICGVLLENFEKLWTFTRILGMEPTNNMAERDLRKLVPDHKSFQRNLRPNFSVQQSAEGDGNLHQVVEPEHKAGREKMGQIPQNFCGRALVIWRRKSYGTRSNRGKKFVERVTTVAQTIRKQGGNVLHFIQKTIECFYSQVLPPLISEAMGF